MDHTGRIKLHVSRTLSNFAQYLLVLIRMSVGSQCFLYAILLPAILYIQHKKRQHVQR